LLTDFIMSYKGGRPLTHSLLTIIVSSYLLGSIPFGYLLVRIFRGEDVRQTGSGNIGATNVARTGSKGLAIATLLLDALKGYVAVAHAFHFAHHHAAELPPSQPNNVYTLAALAGFCAIVGHMFPVWLRFKGGKGVATAVGAFLGIAPTGVLVALALFVAIVALTRYVSLGSMVGAAVFPFAAWWLSPETRTLSVMVVLSASALLVIIRHKDNVRRLLLGNESRFGSGQKGRA
jgi:acyl phosphate:glycerol-3-phosphate acyltransferase